MPKIYSEEEKNEIRSRLKKEAAICMARSGIKKTTVDELVVKAQIPKGTFYLFYESKEILLFEVLLELHEKVENKLFQMMKENTRPLDCDTLTDWIVDLYLDTDNEPIFKVMETGDINVLMEKLPNERIQDHMQHDMGMLSLITQGIPGVSRENAEGITPALQTVFLMMVYLRHSTEIDVKKAVRVLIRGVMIQLFEGGKQYD